MIVPPIMRDYPLYPSSSSEKEGGDTSSATSFTFRRMLTPIFFTKQQEEEEKDDAIDFYGKPKRKETPDSSSSSSFYNPLATSSYYYSYYQGNNNLPYSFLAGIFQGLGASAVAAESATTALTPANMARVVLPGFLAFETHHALSRALYQGVFHEAKPRSKFMARTSNATPIGVFENVLNYELHIVAGATAGLVYSLANVAMLPSASTATRTTTATHMLGFAALFGGYDVYSDVFGSMLLHQDQDQASSGSSNMAVIGLAGGCASVTQASILNLRRNMVSMRTMEFASDTAARYATAATAQASTAVGSQQLVRAFVPGAAAFLVYERFGTLLAQQ